MVYPLSPPATPSAPRLFLRVIFWCENRPRFHRSAEQIDCSNGLGNRLKDKSLRAGQFSALYTLRMQHATFAVLVAVLEITSKATLPRVASISG